MCSELNFRVTMKKKSVQEELKGQNLRFSEAMRLAMRTPHLTRKQIDQIVKEEKEKKKRSNSGS